VIAGNVAALDLVSRCQIRTAKVQSVLDAGPPGGA